jgi:hypothetical protein
VQQFCKLQVLGSNPSVGSNKKMINLLRLLIGAAAWLGILYLDVVFLLSRAWPTTFGGEVPVGFEGLVVANLTFLLIYITLRE